MSERDEANLAPFRDPLWSEVLEEGLGRDEYEQLALEDLQDPDRPRLFGYPDGKSFDGVVRSILPKPADFIFSFDPTGTLLLEDYKLFNVLLSASWGRSDGHTDSERDRSPTVVLRLAMGQRTQRGAVRLEDSLERLTTVELDLDLRENLKHRILPYPTSTLLMGAEVSDNRRFVSWEHWPSLWRHLRGEEVRWARVDLRVCAQLDGIYALRLYEILCMYAGRNYPFWTVGLDELRRRLGAGDTYKEWSSLHYGVLLRAVAELNEKSDLEIKFEPADSARPRCVERVRFTVARKSGGLWSHKAWPEQP